VAYDTKPIGDVFDNHSSFYLRILRGFYATTLDLRVSKMGARPNGHSYYSGITSTGFKYVPLFLLDTLGTRPYYPKVKPVFEEVHLGTRTAVALSIRKPQC
jgi:hypothetical protein